MIDPAHLSAYIASRICHDLVNPVSSVTSALDFLNNPGDADMHEQAKTLLDDGATRTAASLQFLRYAFGSLGLSSGAADMHEFKTITEGYMRNYKSSLVWDLQASELTYGHGRLLMNLIMMANDTLARGGVIDVSSRDEAAGITMTLTCKGKRAKLKPEARMAVDGDTPEGGWRSETIQPYFAKMMVDSLDGEVTISEAEEKIIILVTGIRKEG